MIDIEIKRARDGRIIKIYARNENQPPVTVTVMQETLHLYSHADMSHEDWMLLSIRVVNVITEMKRRDESEAYYDTSTDT